MFVVALTGGIGSGKSAVAEILSNFGVPIIDADLLARELVEPGSPVLVEIAEYFGSDMITAEGRLDRMKMRNRVFADDRARKRLESLLHPRIRQMMEDRLAVLDTPYAVVVIPLLFESGQTNIADRILVVDIPEALQIERVKERDGLDESQIRRVMAVQSDRKARLDAADDIIDNTGDFAALKAQTERLHQRYLSLAAAFDNSAS